MTGNELRKKFLQFFASKDHLILPSAPLIPENDPTLLLIGAGMAPFKPFFTGKMKPPHLRISTSQKCVRTGDIENVGRTARHHTFFEMLGNFSFGDYFKKEAIGWAWEFITQELTLPVDKLWVTIHTKDDEAYDIWKNDIGVSPERIIRLEDNFWEIGPGPCGPCSEIYVDLGEDRGCGNPDCGVGCNCDRFLEIWNLVFTQYDRDEAGNYTPLAKKNIDTGAGLERIASVLQNKKSNFETDLLFPLIEQTAKLAGVTYGQSAKTDVSLKVIADHARSVTVMIVDGILPSNEGRGYVERRVLRRAVRHGRLLGINKPFMADLVDVVAAIFSEPYPYIAEKKAYIKRIILQEEERFGETLAQGMELLNTHIQNMKQNQVKVLDGEIVFRLYDTFGFPWELTQEILTEHDLSLDKTTFDQAMDKQRERARAARQEQAEKVIIPDLSQLVTQELGYDEKADTAEIVLILKDGQVVESAVQDEDVAVIMNVTSFYAEGGGQVGDIGRITAPAGQITVVNTKKLPDGTIYHIGHVSAGTVKTGEPVKLLIDAARHRDTARNHTATHLLHAALKQVLGSHVNQAGSLVTQERLRFDFSHFAQVTEEELAQVESIVNQVILAGIPVGIIETTQETAKEMGAMALFGEKYGERVRVVIAGDFSKELCGGSHVSHTGEIGLFKIIGEAGIGSGLRRIEAVTGQGTVNYVKQLDDVMAKAARLLKIRPDALANRLEAVLAHVKDLEKELTLANAKLARNQVQELLNTVSDVNGIQVVTGQVSAADMDDLRSIADMAKDRLDSGVVVFGAVSNEKVNFVAMATKKAVERGIHAGAIVKAAAQMAGGGGGGRPDMAQAGGRQPEKIAAALDKAKEIIKNQINK
ncbi:alanine-trna ligase class iic [Lucifera butyrica]|uniref:Alanine--tRNA ligase n=1 Tax=Lucifera butyrica TaxID=1351585 RepID=A0A498R3P3_9FIRM|nr:alanine--tRNA ligase [Lucifera butyrica]VBB06024.1 alanine-trna ligase class iic [Lucifera butyrica]